MDWIALNRVRRAAGPRQAELVEAYASGTISRRSFVKRGAVLGLSAPVVATVLAACGSDESSSDVRRERARPAQTTSDTTASDSTIPGTTEAAPATTTNTQPEPPETTDEPPPTTEAVRDPDAGLVVAVQTGDAFTGLDPVNMLDLGTYAMVAQQLEYLVGVDDSGAIAPTGLATAWTSNEDASEWTFELREGVLWSDGTPFTSADVAATVDRAVEAGAASIRGLVEVGAVDASDPAVAVFNLNRPDSNFPVFVSMFSPQSAITPVDFAAGTTLDERPVGTGAWVLDDFDPARFVARFSPNLLWWGPAPEIQSLELRGFDTLDEAAAALANREVDVAQQVSAPMASDLSLGGLVIANRAAANHRQIWFNVTEEPFNDSRVRRALALSLDRNALVEQLFDGWASVANDHPALSTLPAVDPGAVPQRERNIDLARALLADAGLDRVAAEIHVGDLQEIPTLAELVAEQSADAGFDLTVVVIENSVFYGEAWCPGFGEDGELPCPGSAAIGIVDYGSRPVPDLVLANALTSDGPWNASNYSSTDFDDQFTAYRESADEEGQREAMSAMLRTLHEDTPVCIPYFFDYLAAHDATVSGLNFTSLGHVITHGASFDQ